MTTREHETSTGTVEATKEKGKELASQAQEQLQQKTTELRSEAGVRFREQVDERSTQAGEQMEAIGQALSRGSEQLRTEGKDAPARAVDGAARKIEDLGGYLRQADADRILRDVEGFARRRPWLTAATGALAGFLASRFVKASSDRRYEQSTDGYPRSGTYSGTYPGTSEYERQFRSAGV